MDTALQMQSVEAHTMMPGGFEMIHDSSQHSAKIIKNGYLDIRGRGTSNVIVVEGLKGLG